MNGLLQNSNPIPEGVRLPVSEPGGVFSPHSPLIPSGSEFSDFLISLLDTLADFGDTDPLPGLVAIAGLLAALIAVVVWPLRAPGPAQKQKSIRP